MTAAVADDPMLATVETRMREERAAVVDRLKDLNKRDKDAIANAGKASAKFHKLAGRHHDKPLNPAALQAERELRMAMGAVENMGRALAAERDRLRLLDDPQEVEKRLREARRTADRLSRFTDADTTRKRGSRMADAPPKNELSSETRKRIVKELNGGKTLGTLAKELDKEGVKPPGRAKEWGAGRTLQIVYVNETGMTLTEARKKNPPPAAAAASAGPGRTQSGQAPAKRSTAKRSAASAAGAKRGSAKSSTAKRSAGKSSTAKRSPAAGKKAGDVTPHDKASQAAGTSRGGTGSRKNSSQTKAAGTRRAATRTGAAAKKK